MSVSSVSLKKYERIVVSLEYVVISYLLAGSWINILFYGAEIVLGGFYFLNSRPNLFVRWSLSAALLIDTICTAVICYNVYYVYRLYLHVHNNGCSQPPFYVLTVVLWSNKYFSFIGFGKLITFLACLLLIAQITEAIQVVFHWVFAIRVFVNQAVSPFNFNLAIAAATLSAATDFFIAMVMLYTTSTIKTKYAATRSIHNYYALSSCDKQSLAIYTLTILSNYFILRKPAENAYSLTTDPPAVARPIVFRPTSLNIPQTFTIPTMELTSLGGSPEMGSVSARCANMESSQRYTAEGTTVHIGGGDAETLVKAGGVGDKAEKEATKKGI
ncbi:hypothetical protein BDP27DRAFT_1368449 [Rhodocollybia butyracea]|uniref:Transmembrane protein n=1 Tax=Rhodocollybia butyracea TaxID=206335 RepID=A0A9P5PGD7_9AGAR|nr:hypothetical protein BDP27DRAFT_1368449 [Rhodocollybia butyracea]